MKSDYKCLFKFEIGKLRKVELSYSHARLMQLKLFTPGGFSYWNLFFGKLLLSYHKLPF